SLARVMRNAGVTERTYRSAGEVFRSLTTTHLGRNACDALIHVLAGKDLPAAVYAVALECLRYAAGWSPDRLDANSLIALLGQDYLRTYRPDLAQNVIEPCFSDWGDALDTATFSRYARECGAEPFLKYFCSLVSARRDFAPEIREMANAYVAGHFSLHR